MGLTSNCPYSEHMRDKVGTPKLQRLACTYSSGERSRASLRADLNASLKKPDAMRTLPRCMIPVHDVMMIKMVWIEIKFLNSITQVS